MLRRIASALGLSRTATVLMVHQTPSRLVISSPPTFGKSNVFSCSIALPYRVVVARAKQLGSKKANKNRSVVTRPTSILLRADKVIEASPMPLLSAIGT